MLRRFTSLCLLVVLCALPVEAQTLAHPGLRGNGMAPQAWWKRASFVRFGADTTFADAARSLDTMSEAGVDSMILPDLQPTADAPLPFNERFGTEEELDALLREASARRMHVLLTMPVARLSAGGGEVRFWMTRGIAGFDVGSVSPGDLSVLRGVKSAMTRFPGERILIARTPIQTAPESNDELRHDPVTLHLLSSGEAGPLQASQSSAIDINDVNSLPAWPAGVVPIFNDALLKFDANRSQIHSVLAQRARHDSRTGRHR